MEVLAEAVEAGGDFVEGFVAAAFAGLINYTGVGIMYALRSALVLAESLCGNVSYEKAMRPYVEQVAHGFTEAEKYLFLKGVIIIKTGKPVT